jgi:hypothetical protein
LPDRRRRSSAEVFVEGYAVGPPAKHNLDDLGTGLYRLLKSVSVKGKGKKG